jgi:hypothetical protein
LLFGLYACIGREAPPQDIGTEASIPGATTASSIEPRELSRPDRDDAPDQEVAVAPRGDSTPHTRAPVDAGAPFPRASVPDAGSTANACPYPDYPPTEWLPEPWIFAATTDAAELLAGVQAAMPGRWKGLATTPWTTPYQVEIRFTADGHYSGRCTELPSDCCQAFYYGSDDDTPIKRYRVDDATLSGDVFGEIDIAFAYDDEYGLPAWQGELSSIERDASGNGLRFSFARSDGYGRIEYDLRRAPAAE